MPGIVDLSTVDFTQWKLVPRAPWPLAMKRAPFRRIEIGPHLRTVQVGNKCEEGDSPLRDLRGACVGKSVMAKLPDILAAQQTAILEVAGAKIPAMLPSRRTRGPLGRAQSST